MSNKQEKTPERVMLKNCRLAFPALFEPKATVDSDGKPGKPRYTAVLIIPKDHPQVKEVKSAIRHAAETKWGAKGESILKQLSGKDRLALHDGDTKAEYDGFEGNLFISAASQEGTRPTVIDANRSPLTARDGRPYAGCYVNASIEFYAQDNQFGKRVNAQIRGVQFYRDGDAFSAGRPADADEFEDVAEGADADDFDGGVDDNDDDELF